MLTVYRGIVATAPKWVDLWGKPKGIDLIKQLNKNKIDQRGLDWRRIPFRKGDTICVEYFDQGGYKCQFTGIVQERRKKDIASSFLVSQKNSREKVEIRVPFFSPLITSIKIIHRPTPHEKHGMYTEISIDRFV